MTYNNFVEIKTPGQILRHIKKNHMKISTFQCFVRLKKVKMSVSCSVVSHSLQPHGL